MTRVLLVGAGHAHVEVLRRFGLRSPPDVHLTLLTPDRFTAYSGMLPGLVAGHYSVTQAHIDTDRLAAFADADARRDAACGIDLGARAVLCRDGPPIGYDLLSLDIGGHPGTGGVPGAATHAIPVKPIAGFLTRFEALRQDVVAGRTSHVLLVGGGAGGVELLLAVLHRLRRDAPGRTLRFTLVAGSADILPGFPPRFRQTLRAVLEQRGVVIHTGARVVSVEPGRVDIAGGPPLDCDAVLWSTGATPASWLGETGLALDDEGFIRVDAALRAVERSDVFAAGDVTTFDPGAVPRSGVYAVRAGPVLDRGLRAALAGTPPPLYRPSRSALAIVSTGDRRAVLMRSGVVAQGAWAWWLKDWIDRRFVARYAKLGSSRGNGRPCICGDTCDSD